MNNKKIVSILIVLTVIFTILGATFAYYTWTSDNSNKTNITFTIGADFSCGASGGGNIASANLAPASCTNSTYAIQRTITTTITNSGSSPVSLDMWLKVNSIDSDLANTQNFKWALTKSSISCSSNVVGSGTFYGKSANSTITLFTEAVAADTYYLYIWLDSAETNTATMNKSFSLSLGGACTNEEYEYVYTANLTPNGGDYTQYTPGYDFVSIGESISNNVSIYRDPGGASAAMAALKTASHSATDYYYFLKHKLIDGTVTDSYVGFVITDEMVTTNYSTYTAMCNIAYDQMGFSSTAECLSSYRGLIAGTYTLRADNLYEWDSVNNRYNCKSENIDPGTGNCVSSQYYETNVNKIKNAIDSFYCDEINSELTCEIIPFLIYVNSNGNISITTDNNSGINVDYCNSTQDGQAYCMITGAYK